MGQPIQSRLKSWYQQIPMTERMQKMHIKHQHGCDVRNVGQPSNSSATRSRVRATVWLLVLPPVSSYQQNAKYPRPPCIRDGASETVSPRPCVLDRVSEAACPRPCARDRVSEAVCLIPCVRESRPKKYIHFSFELGVPTFDCLIDWFD